MIKSTYQNLQEAREAAQINARRPIWLRTGTEDRQIQILAEMISSGIESVIPLFQREQSRPLPNFPLEHRHYPRVFPSH